jgi:hypothetical protein
MSDRPNDHYDGYKGWAGTNPGWYEVSVHYQDPRESIEKYVEILEWIKQNIQGYKKHSRYRYAGNYLRFKFRYERDYVWFNLTWG